MRNRILMATAEEMNLRGMKFTMSDLAKRLSLSKTSLYEQFPSKNALIHSVITMAITDIREQEEAIYNNPDLAIPEKIKAILRVTPKVAGSIHNRRLFDELNACYPAECQIIDDFQQNQLNRLTELIMQGIENAVLRPVNMKVFRQIVASTVTDLLGYRFLTDSNMTVPDALEEMADILVYGLISPQK